MKTIKIDMNTINKPNSKYSKKLDKNLYWKVVFDPILRYKEVDLYYKAIIEK